MEKRVILLVVCFTTTVLGAGCAVNNPVVTSPTPAPTELLVMPVPTNPVLTSLVGEILKSPQKAGEQVEITGYFRGWDVLHEMGASPPMTRSDWVIADNSGAIYVTGIMPENLDPSSPEQARRVIRLAATIRTKENLVYLEAQSVELLPEQ